MSDATNYNKTLLAVQKLANSSAKTVQSMINKSNKQQMAFNSAEAEKARSWQEKMSKTSHQMEVADLKKAGLNPVLSANNGGAQSYTTSSASTDNDSGASAAAQLYANELGAMSSMESARMSAASQIQASTQQAKATRFAAQQSAAAQRFAASQNYAATRYRAMMDYRINRERMAQERWTVENQNATTWAAFLDKHLRNSGITGKTYDLFKKLFNFNGKNGQMKSSWSLTIDGKKGPKAFEYFSNRPNVNQKNLGLNSKNFKLNQDGYNKAKAYCRKLGYEGTKRNAILFVKGSVFNDPDAVKKMTRITPVKTRQHVRR